MNNLAVEDNTTKKTSNRLVLATPLLIISTGYFVARYAGYRYGTWSWLPVNLFYWFSIGSCVLIFGGIKSFKKWFQPSKGHFLWRLLSLLMAIPVALVIFIPNLKLLNDASLIALLIGIALINPWLEESYWRGLLMDHTSGWPVLFSILFCNFFFAISHPLLLGVNIPALSGVPGFIGTFVMGLPWCIVYRKTQSLRWPVFAHFLVDIFNMSILVFLNKAIFPG